MYLKFSPIYIFCLKYYSWHNVNKATYGGVLIWGYDQTTGVIIELTEKYSVYLFFYKRTWKEGKKQNYI